MGVTMHAPLDALAEEALTRSFAADPLSANVVGARDFDQELPNLSEAFEERRRAELDDIERRAARIDPAELDAEDWVTHATLLFQTRAQRRALDARKVEFAVTPTLGGVHTRILQLVPKVTLAEPQHAGAYLQRCTRVGHYLQQASQRHRQGVARARTPSARGVIGVIDQVDRYLATPLDRDPLLWPAAPTGWRGADVWRDELMGVLDSVVRPAMARYRDHLRDEVLDHARPDERSGLCCLLDGGEVYAQAIQEHTTTALDAEEIHQLGLDLVTALADEYRALGGTTLGLQEPDDIFDRLRNDPALRFQTGGQVRRAAQEALARAEATAPAWFGRLPRGGCVVGEIPQVEAPEAPIAYYLPPELGGPRPGRYWVNTSQPQTRTRFECEALAFHESVPGHHLQCALAQELDLPRFRRLTLLTAYVEGWGLYAERLADEMGLYSSDLTRLGMLSMDSLRAGRLVVDTGLHAKGWSRQQAVDFLRRNSPQAHNNIDNEVDRYIAWPGQAVAYMIGRLEIERLRDRARMRLGDRFDLPGFHDAVLGHGAVPLGVLQEIIDRWIDSHR
ncbi:MAG: DUF885 domain-containing protein [Actinomycetota bacterium]|nr:DUF885 domain-containing protein [Actinomycetota bacterium]